MQTKDVSARIYDSLRRWKLSTVAQLQERLGLSQSQAIQCLQRLKRGGVVTHDGGHPKRWALKDLT